MAYIEIKAIKAVAAVHRGVVNLAHRSLIARDKAADNRKQRKLRYADDLNRLAAATASKAALTAAVALDDHSNEKRKVLAATNTVLNLKDDLNKIG